MLSQTKTLTNVNILQLKIQLSSDMFNLQNIKEFNCKKVANNM